MKNLIKSMLVLFVISLISWSCSDDSKLDTPELVNTPISAAGLALNYPHVTITHQEDGVSHLYNVLMLVESGTRISCQETSDGPNAEFYVASLFLGEDAGSSSEVLTQILSTMTIDDLEYELVSFSISPPVSLNNPKLKIDVFNLRGGGLLGARTNTHDGTVHLPGGGGS